MTGFSVTADGRTQQGRETFKEAVQRIVRAHHAGEPWRVTVFDNNGPRVPTEGEGQRLVAAVTKELA